MSNQSVQVKRLNGEEPREAEAARWRYRPRIDIIDTEKALVLVADLPGSKADQIEVRFDKGQLILRGRVTPRGPAGDAYLMQEYGIGDFEREFRISEMIDAERMEAEYTDGVLTVHLPKSEAARPRTIPVKSK